MKNISIIGAGAWGTALSLLLSDNGYSVTVCSSSAEKAERLEKTHISPEFPDISLPSAIHFTDSLERAAEGEAVLLASASIYTRKMARSLRPYLKYGALVICCAKGIEESTLKMQTQQTEEELPDALVTCLSGPSHAEEVIRRLPTTCVAGAHDMGTARRVQEIFMSPVFRVYTSTDLIGIELGGAVKNVIALAAGAADGLGYGDNAKAALITRGIAEITRLGTAMGASASTISGLTGTGDLIVTCASMHSRNRRAGILIGEGVPVTEAMKEVGQVVEGVYSARAALKLAEKYHVCMPIVEEVNHVLFEGKDPKRAVRDLMMRDPKAETEENA